MSIYEQPEGRAESWIYIEKFEHAIALVVPVADVKDSLVSDGFHEVLGMRLDPRTRKAYSKGSHTGIDRSLMKLPSCKAKQAFGIFIKISVEHPHASILAGNVLLNHHRGIRSVFHRGIVLQQLFFASGDDHLPSCTPGNRDVIACLEHDWKLGFFAKIEHILP